MTEAELELAILRRYTEYHDIIGTAASTPKCQRELDMREVISDILGQPANEEVVKRWYFRLAPPHPYPAILRPCSDKKVNNGPHRFHARAYYEPGNASTWERMAELESKIPTQLLIAKEKEQKFVSPRIMSTDEFSRKAAAMALIFLCHANEDKPQVEELYDRLRALGFEPWMDKRDLIPGQRWQREIPRVLKTSALVLVCLSQNIGRPGYVQREFKLALDALQEIPENYIHTIPVRLDPCNVPDQFAELHWCNLFEPNGFDVLVSAIRYGLEQRGDLIPELQSSPLPQTFTNSIGMEFVLIHAGSFMMGSPNSSKQASDHEKPVHRVEISQPFYLGKYPVTRAQWQAVIGHNPSQFKSNPDCPVETVSWNNAQAFIRR